MAPALPMIASSGSFQMVRIPNYRKTWSSLTLLIPESSDSTSSWPLLNSDSTQDSKIESHSTLNPQTRTAGMTAALKRTDRTPATMKNYPVPVGPGVRTPPAHRHP